jgi:hypothetical protein
MMTDSPHEFSAAAHGMPPCRGPPFGLMTLRRSLGIHEFAPLEPRCSCAFDAAADFLVSD